MLGGAIGSPPPAEKRRRRPRADFLGECARRPRRGRYTERQRFKFKLSRWQCRDLIETMCQYDAKQRARRLLGELQLA